MCRILDSKGQASVELVALLPVVLVLIALLWQCVLLGRTVWLASASARAAARAQAVGGDPLNVVRRMVPRRFKHTVRVHGGRDGRLCVRLPVPAVISGIKLGSVGASAYFAPQR